MFALGCLITAYAGGGSIPGIPDVEPFELVDETGSATITGFPGLRVSIAGGAWQTLAAAGLTISQTADGELTVAGFASPQAVRFHIEHEQPGEPFNSPGAVAAIWSRFTGAAPNPANSAMPGLPLAASDFNNPIEVLP